MKSAVSHLSLLPGVIKFAKQKASCDQERLRFCCHCGFFVCFSFCLNETENFKQS